MSNPSDLMEIKETAIGEKIPAAQALIDGFDHTPRLAKPKDIQTAKPKSPGIGSTRRRFRSTTPGLVTASTARAEGVHIIARIEAVDADDALMSPVQAGVLHGLRRALATALTVVDQYSDATGLSALMKTNLQGKLPDSKKTEFNEGLAASSVIALHVFANMASYLLSSMHDTSELSVDVGEVEEVLTDNPQLALTGALWELDQDLAVFADSESKLIPTVTAFLEQLMEKAALRAANLPRLDAFTSVAYRVEEDDFEIRGFEASSRGKSSKLTMTFKKPHEVVGNHIAKYQAMKLSKMLMAYDFDRKLNPFADLGGFIFTFMGDGAPGTGKTTLIQMMAGLLNDYCNHVGYPFRYANLSTDSIDSYQGKSAQNAKSFISQIIDPNVIGFGTIDDIDQLAGKRGDRQSSAGQLEITAVLMESFAGANTVVRGNCTFGMFSNYPENVDDALRQRAARASSLTGRNPAKIILIFCIFLWARTTIFPSGNMTSSPRKKLKKRSPRVMIAMPNPKKRLSPKSMTRSINPSASSIRLPSSAPI